MENIEYSKRYVESLKNPNKIGPGFWVAYFILAYNCLNEKQSTKSRNRQISSLLDIIIVTLNNFPCQECRNHAKEYLPTLLKDFLHALNNKKLYKEKNMALVDIFIKFKNIIALRINRQILIHTYVYEFLIKNAEEGCTKICTDI